MDSNDNTWIILQGENNDMEDYKDNSNNHNKLEVMVKITYE